MIKAERVEYQQTERGAIPIYADQIVEQPQEYAASDHEVWRLLLQRQNSLVSDKAHPLFLSALEQIDFDQSIPSLADINKKTIPASGWRIVAVNGLLSDLLFFELLKNKQFPVTWWIRKKHQLEYIQEPDLFHDLYGHVPMILLPQYADLLCHFGRVGTDPNVSQSPELMMALARMYWFSIEFGLMRHQNEVRAFGAGLLSSIGEIDHALGSDPDRQKMTMRNMIKCSYKIDAYQPLYFVCDKLSDIEKSLTDFEKYVAFKTK